MIIAKMYNYQSDQLDDFVIDKLAEFSSISSPIYWANGLFLSPVFILFVSIALIALFLNKQQKQRKKSLSINASLLNEDNDAWQADKLVLNRLVMVHSLLLFAWVIWKWLTTPFIKTQIGKLLSNVYT